MEQRKQIVRIPPQNLDSEKSLLGSILFDPSVFENVTRTIKPSSFYYKPNEIIFSALLRMKILDMAIDIVTLGDYLRNNNQLDAIGGMSYLAELVVTVPSSANVDHYAKIVQDKYARRQIIQLAEKIANSGYDETTPVKDSLLRTGKALKEVEKISIGIKKSGNQFIDGIISSIEKEIVEEKSEHSSEQLSRLDDIARAYAGEDQLVSSHDFIDGIKNQPQQLQILTGFSGVDDLLKGFRPGQLVSIGAIAKAGKTSFCIELTSKQREHNPVWFPFEEGAEELLSKFIERNETPPVFFTPKILRERTLEFIEKKIIEAKAKYKSKIFYVDNLDWIVDPRSNSHDKETQYVCMELKRMCTQWNICIVLIAHVKKLENSTKQPDFNDLKGSSSIYQISDTVIMLAREMKKNDRGELEITNNVNVSVQFNRKYGKTGNIKMVFENGHYTEYDWGRDDKSFGDYSNEKLSTAF